MTQEVRPHPRGISLEEARTRLGIGKTKFHEMLKEESEIETYYIGSRHLVVETSISAWIESRKSSGQPL